MDTCDSVALSHDEVLSIKKFINLDDNLKKSRKEMVEGRKVLVENKNSVIELMIAHDIPTIDLNHGKMVLQIKSKIKKVKPSKDVIMCRMEDAIKSGNIEDMTNIFKMIYAPTEENDGWTLYRRTKKPSKKKPTVKKIKIVQ